MLNSVSAVAGLPRINQERTVGGYARGNRPDCKTRNNQLARDALGVGVAPVYGASEGLGEVLMDAVHAASPQITLTVQINGRPLRAPAPAAK